MAGIGLYGVYYSKATLTDGVITAYGGTKTMGKAISANFAPDGNATDNRLWANNAIAEVDASNSAGGTLTVTIDALKIDAAADLFGLTKATKTVSVGGTTKTGTGFSYTGNEVANAVGVAFIRWHQENNVRSIYEVVIYSYCTFSMPSEDAATYDGDAGISWQTPELEATVTAGPSTGTYPWREKYTFDTEEAAIAYITSVFGSES